MTDSVDIAIPNYELRAGFVVNHGTVCRVMELARQELLGWGQSTPLINLRALSDRTRGTAQPIIFVIRAHHWEYYTNIPFTPGWGHVLRIKIKLVHIGGSSLTTMQYAYDITENPTNPPLVLIQSTTSVAIDPISGKPRKILGEIYDLLKPLISSEPVTLPKSFNYPSPLFSIVYTTKHKMNIYHSLTDSLDHVNQSRYIDLYEDVVHWLVSSKSIENEKVAQFAAAKADALGRVGKIEYMRQVRSGDVVEIIVNFIAKSATQELVGFFFELKAADGGVSNRAFFITSDSEEDLTKSVKLPERTSRL